MSKNQNTAVVGLQWGDEGKGKIVDILTAEHDVIVRYNGGANAGQPGSDPHHLTSLRKMLH